VRRDPAEWLARESDARALPPADAVEPLPLHEAVRQFERIWVDELMRRAGGNVARAARAAGISRPNLHRKMRSLGMRPEDYRKGDES
jgi:two-component system C4-dicarboxylate transport response regulator DctD